MSEIELLFTGDFSDLKKQSISTPEAGFTGAWSTVEFQPDMFVPQHFTIGVVVQTAGDRLHFRLLDNFKRFECVYQDRLPQKHLKELLAHAEEVLRAAAKKKTPATEVLFETSCLSLSRPIFTSGDDHEVTVDRLFQEVVVMGQIDAAVEGTFVAIDTQEARKRINLELKRIANLDYESIVNPNPQGIFLEENGVNHFLDLNLITKRACGSVTSAVYKTAQSVELNLLKSSRDLTTFSRIKPVQTIGLFLLMPEPEMIGARDFMKIEGVIEEYEWKLEQDGFHVVSLPSVTDLAQEVYDWAKPTFA